MANGRDALRHCSFCGRDERHVQFLIPSGDGAYICEDCVNACSELIAEHRGLNTSKRKKNGKYSLHCIFYCSYYNGCIML